MEGVNGVDLTANVAKKPLSLNVVTVSKAHLGRRVGVLHHERMKELCRAMSFALGSTS